MLAGILTGEGRFLFRPRRGGEVANVLTDELVQSIRIDGVSVVGDCLFEWLLALAGDRAVRLY